MFSSLLRFLCLTVEILQDSSDKINYANTYMFAVKVVFYIRFDLVLQCSIFAASAHLLLRLPMY